MQPLEPTPTVFENLPIEVGHEAQRFRKAIEWLCFLLGVSLFTSGTIMLFMVLHPDALGVAPIFGCQVLLIGFVFAAYRTRGRRTAFDVNLIFATVICLVTLLVIRLLYHDLLPVWIIFGLWLLMITPWSLVAYSGSMWLLWILAFNGTIIFAYLDLRPDIDALLFIFIALTNLVFLALWEYFLLPIEPFRTRAGPRLLAFFALLAWSLMAVHGLGNTNVSVPMRFVYIIPWILNAMVFARIWGVKKENLDVYIAAITCLSLIATSVYITGYVTLYPFRMAMPFALTLCIVLTIIGVMAASVWLRYCFQNRKLAYKKNFGYV